MVTHMQVFKLDNSAGVPLRLLESMELKVTALINALMVKNVVVHTQIQFINSLSLKMISVNKLFCSRW
jgi:hypothetical protein